MPIAKFKYVALMSLENPFSNSKSVTPEMLTKMIEITHADNYIPSIPLSKIKKSEIQASTDRKIYVFERAGQFDILRKNPETYMLVSPIPKDIISALNLVQKNIEGNTDEFIDTLIYRKNYSLSKLDKIFISELEASSQINVSNFFKNDINQN